MKNRLPKIVLGALFFTGLVLVSTNIAQASVILQQSYSADDLDASYTTGQVILLGTGLHGGLGQLNIPFELQNSITNVYKMVQIVYCDDSAYSVNCTNAITDTITDTDGTWNVYREGPVGGFTAGINVLQLQLFNLTHKVSFNPAKWYSLTYKVGTAWLHDTNKKGLGLASSGSYPNGLSWNSNHSYLPSITIQDTGVSGFVNFKSPVQLPYSGTVNGSTTIASVAISDFTLWQVQLANVPPTTTPMTLTVSTILGSNSINIPANSTSSTYFTIYTIPKNYSLPSGSTTTPINYSATATLTYNNSGAVVGSDTTYFNLALGAPAIVPWANGTYTGLETGCGYLCTDQNLIQQNLNQQFANDQIRGQLGNTFPFSYFYQISDIISGLQTSATTSTSTEIDLSFNFGRNTTTTVAVFSDNQLTRSPFASTLSFLKNIITICLYVFSLLYFYRRIKSILNYSSSEE
jgi:hypothetical protein